MGVRDEGQVQERTLAKGWIQLKPILNSVLPGMMHGM